MIAKKSNTSYYTVIRQLFVLYIEQYLPLLSVEGFCDYEEVETRLGIYNWPETIIGQNSTMPCYYNQLLEEEGNYTRMCESRSLWKDVNSMSCISEVTYNLMIIANVSLLINLTLKGKFQLHL